MLWNMKVTVILIVVGALGTIPVRGVEEFEIRGQEEILKKAKITEKLAKRNIIIIMLMIIVHL